jgi:TM2 domain-containing membrane protein YozV
MIFKQSLFIFLIVVMFQSAFSSDLSNKVKIFTTGNPKVDLFSSSVKLPNENNMFENPQEGISSDAVKKSPLLAGGLSLVVPGAGEIYNGDYVKAGLFIAIEAASWIFSYNLSNKGDEITTVFQNFVNERVDSRPTWDVTEPNRYRTKWDVIRYYEWTKSNFFPASNEYNDVITTDDKTLPPWERVNWGALNRLERDVSLTDIGKWYSHVLPGYGEQQYYELIGKYQQFNQGWDDATDPNFTYGKKVTANFLFYSEMRGLANDYYYKAKTAAVIIVANHILSAADAYFSARAFNSKLSAEFRMENQDTPFGKIPTTFGTLKYHF